MVRLYGAGGPDTAFRKVADLWTERTGTELEVVAGPDADWTADAQASADILWGNSEQSMTAFLLTYAAFDLMEVESIYLHLGVIAVAAGNLSASRTSTICSGRSARRRHRGRRGLQRVRHRHLGGRRGPTGVAMRHRRPCAPTSWSTP